MMAASPMPVVADPIVAAVTAWTVAMLVAGAMQDVTAWAVTAGKVVTLVRVAIPAMAAVIGAVTPVTEARKSTSKICAKC